MLKSGLIVLSYAASVALAGDLYYAFYNDNQCKTGEGLHVDSTNDGCLKEYGRQGVGPAGGNAGLYFPILIGYSDDNCQNEIGCNAMPASDNGGYCLDLTREEWQWSQKATSFRFVTKGAAAAVCPNGCVGECPGGHAPSKRDTIDAEKRALEAAAAEYEAEKRALGERQAGNGYYAYCSNDDCTDCGTAINPLNGGCSIEGSRKSVFSSNPKTIVLSGYNTPDQSCTGDVTGTVKLAGKGCTKITSGAEGGPNAYQVTTVEDAHKI